MPITTPSTVSPARSLFLRRARKAIRKVNRKPMPARFGRLLPPLHCRLNADHELVADFQIAGDHLRVLAVGEARDDLDGPELVAIDNPHMPAIPGRAGGGPID